MTLNIGIPETTLIVTLTAIGLGFASNVATRFLVDLKKERRLRAETTAFDKELREAIQKKDKAKEDKLKNSATVSAVRPGRRLRGTPRMQNCVS